MRTLPDKAFQLAIADPPYGIGEDGAKNHSRRKAAPPTLYTPKDWDTKAPDKEFFNELFRVCRHVIIWGGNHFIENLPRQNASCWVVWDKENGENDFADCELEWTSLPCAVRLFRFRWAGMLQGDMSHKESRIHPTKKPVALYAWLLNKFLQPAKTRIRKMAFGYMTYAIMIQTQDGKKELIGKMFFIGRILISQKKISYGTDKRQRTIRKRVRTRV